MLDLILSTVTKNVLNMANSLDPDGILPCVVSHLGLRYFFQMLPLIFFFHKCINHVPTILSLLIFRQFMPLLVTPRLVDSTCIKGM